MHFPHRTTPGAGARTGHSQEWERSCWKPAEGPAAEKRDHGRNVSAEGKRPAAVSEAATVGWTISCRTSAVWRWSTYCVVVYTDAVCLNSLLAGGWPRKSWSGAVRRTCCPRWEGKHLRLKSRWKSYGSASVRWRSKWRRLRKSTKSRSELALVQFGFFFYWILNETQLNIFLLFR